MTAAFPTSRRRRGEVTIPGGDFVGLSPLQVEEGWFSFQDCATADPCL
jgi:hypothetical protein